MSVKYVSVANQNKKKAEKAQIYKIRKGIVMMVISLSDRI